MQLDTKTLVGKLNPACKSVLNAAAQLCVQKTHFTVETEHVLLKLLDHPEADAAQGLQALGIEMADLVEDLQTAVDQFRQGNTRTPSLPSQISELLQAAWVFSSQTLKQPATRSAALLQAVLDSPALRDALNERAPAWASVPEEALREIWPEIMARSGEEMPTALDIRKADAKAAKSRKKHKRSEDTAPSAQNADREETQSASEASPLSLYTVSLTDQALIGAIDPIVGRDGEIRQSNAPQAE